MKFNILYYTFSTLKLTILINLCLLANTVYAQNSCGNDAGEPRPDLFICFGERGFGNSTGTSLNATSVIQYYLHDNNLSNPIDSNQYGFFDNNGNYPLNTTLLITGVAGPADQNGIPLLNDMCTDIQEEGTKIVFLEQVEITSSLECYGTNAEINYSVDGGLPAFDGSAFDITGDDINVVSANTNNSFVSLGITGSYSFSATDGNMCEAFETDQYNCQLPEDIDLALIKKLAPGQALTVSAGTNIIFQIEVINQGNVPLKNIKIIDYIPSGLILADPDWITVGSNAETNLPGVLPPSSSIFVNITLNSLPTTQTVTIQNAAEIMIAERANGDIVNVDSDGVFDNDANNNGVPVNDAVNDANDDDDHDIENIIIEPSEACLGTAGSMPTDTIFACFGDEISVSENNSVLDPNRDVAYYVLHDNDTNVINPNSITATSNDGTFTNPGNTDCRVFYVSYVFGPDSGDGTPNLSNECTIVLPGTPVIWLSPIVINSTADCANNGDSFTVNYIVNGGYPACFNSTYTVGGTVANVQVNASVNIFDDTVFNNASDYSISIKDDKGCVETTNFDPVICEDQNPCDIVAGSMPLDTIFACAGTTVREVEEGSILDDKIGFYYLHDYPFDSLGTIFAKNSTGEFEDIGNHCQTLYLSYAIGPDNGSGEPILFEECSLVLPGTPVVWASPIIIESVESCNTTNLGFYNYNYNINGGFAECSGSLYTLSGDINTPFAQPGFEYYNNMLLPGGSTYSFTATDIKGCDKTYNGGPIECETDMCNNSRGTMPSRIKYACAEGSITSTERNSDLNINDVGYYVLHEGSTDIIENPIITSPNGSFEDPGDPYYCETLYISYVFGPNDGYNQPDLTSDCTRILKGTPVTWSAPIEISTLVECNEETEKFEFSYILRGGFPSCGNNNYYVTCDVTNSMAVPGQIFDEPTFFDDGDTYCIDVTDDKGCTNSFTSEPITCQNPNPCGENETGKITPNLSSECAGVPIIVEVEDNFVDDGYVDGFVLHNGDSDEIGTIVSSNTDGAFDDPDRPCETLIISYLIGSDDGTGFPDIDDPCTMFSSAPAIWFPPVEISSTATCDETTGNLIVNYTIGGGASTCSEGVVFNISGDVEATGIEAGSYVVDNQISSDEPYQITATDLFECSATFTSDLIDCTQVDPFCGNVLGAMQFSNQTRVCSGIKASVQQENTTLADDAIGLYYLHTNSDNTLGTPIDSNISGQFADPGADYKCDTLYISYVIGPDDDDDNEIDDLDGECTFVLPGAPVVWAPEIQILSTSVGCDGQTGEYKFGFSLSGGFPECFTSVKYSVSGTISGTISDSFLESGLSPGDYTSSESFDSGTSYQLTVEDGLGCSDTTSESDIINCPGVSECSYINFPGTPKAAQFICNGERADGSVKDYSLDQYYEISYILHDSSSSVGNIYECNNTGIFNNYGIYPRNEQLYISSVVGIPHEEGKPNFDDDCTLTMLPGTPVVFLEELQMQITSTVCDTISGGATISYRLFGGYPAFDNSALYNISGSDMGSIRINIAKSFFLPGTSYELIADDGLGGCSTRISDMTNCGNDECVNQLGSQPFEAVILCEGERVDASVDNFNIVDSAQLVYLLYNETIDNIIDKNGTGIFINNEENLYPNNIQLYVSAVIGMLDEFGTPDFSDPCLIRSIPGTPVTFLPAINVTTSCEFVNDSITVKFVITGGSEQYTISGDYTGNSEDGDLASFTLPGTASNFTLNITDDNNCIENYFETISNSKNCDNNNNPDQVPQNDRFLCGGESITITTINIPQVDDGFEHYYFLHDGINNIGDVADFNTTGTFVNNGDYDSKKYYISSVITKPLGDNPCFDCPCLVASLPGTPVTFYDPITVSAEEVCNNSTGNYVVQFSINGGAPAVDESKFYEVSGIHTNNNIAAGQIVTTGDQSNSDYVIIVKDDNNCGITFTKNDVDCNFPCPQFNKESIVNVISPNRDGINDSWSVPGLNGCYPNHRITICNRWGSKVFEVENCINDCWDGTVSKNGEPLPTGAYYYIIELNGENSTEDEIVKGSITLLR